MIFQLLQENQASQGVQGEPFPDEDHGGPSPKLEHINLDKEQDQQRFNPKDLDEQMQDPPE